MATQEAGKARKLQSVTSVAVFIFGAVLCASVGIDSGLQPLGMAVSATGIVLYGVNRILAIYNH